MNDALPQRTVSCLAQLESIRCRASPCWQGCI